ncbi:hypothetical protein [Sphingobacterium sp.]|uniref:hypothetical protein n=1 Tax=Sphingobacterium sp. TaxID=341027 RepID=UPI0031E3A15C
MAGINPITDRDGIETYSHLPEEIGHIIVSNVKIGNLVYELEQQGRHRSILSYTGRKQMSSWRAGFVGSHPYLYFNGRKVKSSILEKNGVVYSYIDLKITTGQQYTVATQ